MVEFNDRRKEKDPTQLYPRLKPGRVSKAEYEKGMAEAGLEEVRMADVRQREGKPNLSMTGEEYEKWKETQPRGSHRVTYRTVTRKKKQAPE
jgi:hypothetical protein